MRVANFALTVALLSLGSALPAFAQQKGAKPTAEKGAAPKAEPELKFEREYFLYPAASHREPFASLAARSGLGPRFEDLALQGIVFAPDGQSVALLADDGGRIYRLRRGEMVGNARIISIAPMKVLFAVENFGVVRQEQLELKRKDNEGDQP